MNGSTIDVLTQDGVADCCLTKPAGDGAHPGVLFMIDAIGLRPRIEEMADRIAAEGYVVLAPNVFYRAGRAPLWETPDLHDPDSRGRFFESLGPLGALSHPPPLPRTAALIWTSSGSSPTALSGSPATASAAGSAG